MPALDLKHVYELLGVLATVVVCFVGYRFIMLARRSARGELVEVDDPLKTFRDALAAGEIDREEYERIRAAMDASPPPAPGPKAAPELSSDGVASPAHGDEIDQNVRR